MKIFVSGCSLLIVCLLKVHLLFAQNTAGSLAVQPNDNISVDRLFSQLKQAPADSQTNILLKISKYYWYEGTAQGLDSCYLFAIKTRDRCITKNNIEEKNEANFMLCKVLLREDKTHEAFALLSLVSGEEKVRLLMVLGEHFLFMPDLKKDNTDKAFTFISNAGKLCDSLHSRTWKYSRLLLLGKYYFAVGNASAGKQSIMQIINDCIQTKNIALEAHYWSELGKYMPSTDSTYLDQLHSHQMAANLFFQVDDKEDGAYSLRDVAILNIFHNRVDKAEQQMLQVISILKSIKSPLTFNTYNVMSIVYSHKGDYGKSLYYLLLGNELLKPEQWHDKRTCYDALAEFYQYLNMPDKSIYFFRKALSIDLREVERSWSYHIVCDMIDQQVVIGQQKDAYSWLNNFTRNYPPKNNSDRMFEATAYGKTYNALKMYKQAEQSYLQMIFYAGQVEVEGTKNAQWGFQQSARVPYYNMGKFYVERQKYAVAKSYLLKALDFNNENDPVINMNTEYQLYKVNSEIKNFRSSLHNFEVYVRLKDSMSNITKTRQLEELQIKYQTNQNQQAIKLLQSRSKYQQTEIANSKFQKNVYTAGVGAAVSLAGLAFFGYQGKKRSNLKLEKKQVEINRQNSVQQKLLTDKDELISDKDALIKEKELLLREIHHRVKNNLQIVISLLNIQSSYLTNDSALEAINESQGRIRSIALIHQKLYGNTNVRLIGMSEYIPELINYLGDSMGISKKNIAINYAIQPVNLDISQAVPVGLIINEAITNSIKYAFENSDHGQIHISMTSSEWGGIDLSITDNGRGMAKAVDVDNIKTMGLSLIRGLVSQLDGTCEFINNNGFVINLKFIKDAFFADSPEYYEEVLS